MRPLREIIGLYVISHSGNCLGTVEDLVLDNKKMIGMGFLVRNKEWYKGMKFIYKEEIEVVGKDTVLTSESFLKSVIELPEIIEILDNSIEWRGLPVYTTTGEILGKVEELFLDEKTLEISGIKIKDEEFVIDRSSLVALGPSAVIVRFKTDQPEVLKEGSSLKQEEAVSLEDKGFEARQNAFLIGKRLSRDLIGEDGILIASKGDIVNLQIIRKMKSLNRMQELINSIEQ
ncbi:MAG: PRC-barrel domain-containing protein [bacterium]|nr:PRC-barrel domain-containing protein [bacterium]